MLGLPHRQWGSRQFKMALHISATKLELLSSPNLPVLTRFQSSTKIILTVFGSSLTACGQVWSHEFPLLCHFWCLQSCFFFLIVWSHFYEISRDTKQNSGYQYLGRGANGEWLFNEKMLELHGGDNCTTLWTYEMPLNSTL